MFLVLILSYVISGKFIPVNMHLTAYGFILAGIGYIIEELKKKEQTSADHLKYVLHQQHQKTVEEIRTIRTMIFKMQERKDKNRESPVGNSVEKE